MKLTPQHVAKCILSKSRDWMVEVAMLQYLLQQQNSWHSGNFVGQRGKGQCALTSFVPTHPYCKEGSALRLYDAIGTGLRRQTFIVKRFFSLNSHTLNASIVRSSLAIFQLHVLTNDRAGIPGVPYSCVGFTGCIITCSSHVNVCVWNFQLIMTPTPPLSHCWTWGLTSAPPPCLHHGWRMPHPRLWQLHMKGSLKQRWWGREGLRGVWEVDRRDT